MGGSTKDLLKEIMERIITFYVRCLIIMPISVAGICYQANARTNAIVISVISSVVVIICQFIHAVVTFDRQRMAWFKKEKKKTLGALFRSAVNKDSLLAVFNTQISKKDKNKNQSRRKAYTDYLKENRALSKRRIKSIIKGSLIVMAPPILFILYIIFFWKVKRNIPTLGVLSGLAIVIPFLIMLNIDLPLMTHFEREKDEREKKAEENPTD